MSVIRLLPLALMVVLFAREVRAQERDEKSKQPFEKIFEEELARLDREKSAQGDDKNNPDGEAVKNAAPRPDAGTYDQAREDLIKRIDDAVSALNEAQSAYSERTGETLDQAQQELDRLREIVKSIEDQVAAVVDSVTALAETAKELLRTTEEDMISVVDDLSATVIADGLKGMLDGRGLDAQQQKAAADVIDTIIAPGLGDALKEMVRRLYRMPIPVPGAPAGQGDRQGEAPSAKTPAHTGAPQANPQTDEDIDRLFEDLFGDEADKNNTPKKKPADKKDTAEEDY